jgi:hypothetical protein
MLYMTRFNYVIKHLAGSKKYPCWCTQQMTRPHSRRKGQWKPHGNSRREVH